MTVNLRDMTDKQLDKRLTDLEIAYLSCQDWWEENTIKTQYQAALDEKERRQMAKERATEEFINEILDGLTPNTCRTVPRPMPEFTPEQARRIAQSPKQPWTPPADVDGIF